jgi:hypothetical protein
MDAKRIHAALTNDSLARRPGDWYRFNLSSNKEMKPFGNCVL